MKGLLELPAVADKTEEVNVIIETPRGSRSKFDYDPETGLFLLAKTLPVGAVFPYDFGFIPSTKGEDGDPVDVLVLMDEAVHPGILLKARLIGAIAAEQTEKEKTVRNDRLIAVASVSLEYQEIAELKELNPNIVDQIEHFFVSYNEMAGKTFKPLERLNARAAHKLVDAGRKAFRK